jgi:hypothetical protein
MAEGYPSGGDTSKEQLFFFSEAMGWTRTPVTCLEVVL